MQRVSVQIANSLVLKLFFLVCLCLSISPGSVLSEEPVSLGEVTINKSELAYQGFTLFPATGTAQVHLLDMNGSIVNTWDVDANRARLLPNGNLLVVHMSRWGRRVPEWRELMRVIREYTWDGEVAWEYEATDVVHHDLRKLDNGNVLFLGRSLVPEKLLKTVDNPYRRFADTRTDSVVEVNMEGEVVWEWAAHDHIDLNYCGARGCEFLDRNEDTRREIDDWTHVNSVQALPENKWYDAGDERFKPGNVLIMPRNWWTAILIDRESGKIVWEYSGDYKGGLGGGHEPHMIEKGLPGAGNILIFDNGQRNSNHPGESFLLEINPVTKEIVWIYEAGEDFFSNSRGSMQRLPNGNTLISEDNTGRVFEVTPDKQIAWEFRGSVEHSRAARYSNNYAPQLSALSGAKVAE